MAVMQERARRLGLHPPRRVAVREEPPEVTRVVEIAPAADYATVLRALTKVTAH